MSEWWRYENLESGAPYDWSPATKGDKPDDQIDYHIDLGCGTVPKARLGIDRFVDDKHKIFQMDLDDRCLEFPWPDNSIESIISHHCLEHIGYGFIRLMDECYRILKPGGIFRIIVPCFPSFSAVDDPDHVRYFTPRTFDSFVHNATEDVPFWTESFSVPYTSARFKMRELDYTPAETLWDMWGYDNNEWPGKSLEEVSKSFSIDKLFEKGREIRVSLEK